MKIGIYNDGKSKYNSVEASLCRLNTINLVGYGENKEKAIDDLKSKIGFLIESLKDIDYQNTMNADCFGHSVEVKE